MKNIFIIAFVVLFFACVLWLVGYNLSRPDMTEKRVFLNNWWVYLIMVGLGIGVKILAKK